MAAITDTIFLWLQLPLLPLLQFPCLLLPWFIFPSKFFN
jgi:hypothetical protein